MVVVGRNSLNATIDNMIQASKGMKFVRLRVSFQNNGTEDCLFDLEKIYLSTERDSLYIFTALEGSHINITVVKPQKKLQRILIFEFPKNATPKELFIEDKRYKVALKEK